VVASKNEAGHLATMEETNREVPKPETIGVIRKQSQNGGVQQPWGMEELPIKFRSLRFDQQVLGRSRSCKPIVAPDGNS